MDAIIIPFPRRMIPIIKCKFLLDFFFRSLSNTEIINYGEEKWVRKRKQIIIKVWNENEGKPEASIMAWLELLVCEFYTEKILNALKNLAFHISLKRTLY